MDGFYPSFGVKHGTKEWDDHIMRQRLPHPLDKPYVCGCVKCEEWHRVRVVPGSIVVGRVLDHRKGGSGGQAWTWRCDEEPNCGNPIEKPSLVLGVAVGIAAGGSAHNTFDYVLILTPDMGLRVTAARWLVVLAGERTAQTTTT